MFAVNTTTIHYNAINCNTTNTQLKLDKIHPVIVKNLFLIMQTILVDHVKFDRNLAVRPWWKGPKFFSVSADLRASWFTAIGIFQPPCSQTPLENKVKT